MFGPHLNVKIGLRKSKFDIQPYFEHQNRISNIKTRFLDPILISKLDFECKNSIFAPFSNVCDFDFQNSIFGPNSNIKIGFRMSKCDIRRQFVHRHTTSGSGILYQYGRFPSYVYFFVYTFCRLLKLGQNLNTIFKTFIKHRNGVQKQKGILIFRNINSIHMWLKACLQALY